MDGPLIAAIASALELVEPKLSEESTSSNTEGWDSFANLNVIAEIERRFELEVPLEVAVELQSVADWRRYLRGLGRI